MSGNVKLITEDHDEFVVSNTLSQTIYLYVIDRSALGTHGLLSDLSSKSLLFVKR